MRLSHPKYLAAAKTLGVVAIALSTLLPACGGGDGADSPSRQALSALAARGRADSGCDWASFGQRFSKQAFSSNGAISLGTTSAVAVDSESVLVTYDNFFDGRRDGKSVLVSAAGAVDRAPVTFHAGPVTAPSALFLHKHAVFIAFRDDNEAGQGKYVVIDPVTGAVQRAETVFHAGGTTYEYRAAAATPAAVLVAYRDESDNYRGKFVVVNPNSGKFRVPETTFGSAAINSVAVAAMDATHVLIAYQELVSWNSYFFVVKPETGELTLPPIAFERSFGLPTAIAVGKNHALIVYRDLSNRGKFIVVDTDTGAQTLPTIYNASSPWDGSVSAALLGTDSVFISYWNPGQEAGKFVVYRTDGRIAIPETVFNDGATYNVSAVGLGCQAVVALQDVGDHQFGKLIGYGAQRASK